MKKVASMSNEDLELLLGRDDLKVIKNLKKLSAVVNNARIYLRMDKEHKKAGEKDGEGFVRWIFKFVSNSVVVNTKKWTSGQSSPPAVSSVSDAMSKEFKAQGTSYLGSITLYAFLQQCGLVNDHCCSCFKNPLSLAKNTVTVSSKSIAKVKRKPGTEMKAKAKAKPTAKTKRQKR